METKTAKQMKEGCKNWATDTIVACEYECGEKSKHTEKVHYCNICQARLSQHKSDLQQELEFLERYYNYEGLGKCDCLSCRMITDKINLIKKELGEIEA
jgi:hypothetical protein